MADNLPQRAESDAARDWDRAHNPTAYATQLRALLVEVVVAADRLMERWAEADEEVRKSLWTALGKATQAAEDEVYPL